MFSYRSTKLEYIDDFTLDSDLLIKNLNEIALINRWLGGYRVIKKSLNKLDKQGIFKSSDEICIVDFGCGGGDVLRYVARWAQRRNIKIKLIGVDANNAILNYARQRSQNYTEISYLQEDVFNADFQKRQFDIILCNLFCHHLDHETFIQFLKSSVEQVSMAVIINDLHRHPFAYYGVKIITRLFNMSSLICHDGPLSVLRAFRRHELLSYLAHVSSFRVSVIWRWAFRYQVVIQPGDKGNPITK